MEVGMVMFFHVRRGFGRIRLDGQPEGVFAHYSDVAEAAKILLPGELVSCTIEETEKGPRARGIQRMGTRLQGYIEQFGQGHGRITAPNEPKTFHFHYADQVGPTHRQPEAGHQVEFSPFFEHGQWQAKEVIISDPRSSLEKYAWLGNWRQHLETLADLAKPESWGLEPDSRHPWPILDNYLKQYFRRIEQEGKIVQHTEADGKRWRLWATGLRTPFGERIFVRCSPNRKRYRSDSYLARPRWVLKDFVTESAYMLAGLQELPARANFFEDPSRILYDASRTWICDYAHILAERSFRLPEAWQGLNPVEQKAKLQGGIDQARETMMENYRLALPQYYQGEIQLLVPFFEPGDSTPVAAMVLSVTGKCYRINTILPLTWAYQNARLIAPLTDTWLDKFSSSPLVFSGEQISSQAS